MYSLVEENYLKALYNISHDKGSVSVNDLSVDLGLKMPTVNSMVKKMAEKGLVVYEKYKPLNLTPNGKKAAGLIVRKHRLTEMYLVDVMGFGWEQVHEIAEQIEHIQSPLFFEASLAEVYFASSKFSLCASMISLPFSTRAFSKRSCV